MPLRALAGAALAEVWPSPYLMGCAYLLALFLVAGKRQWEFLHAVRPGASAGPRGLSRGRPRLSLPRHRSDDRRRVRRPTARRRPRCRTTAARSALDGAVRHPRARAVRPAGLSRGGGGNPTRAPDRRSVAPAHRDRLGRCGGVDHLWSLIARSAGTKARRRRSPNVRLGRRLPRLQRGGADREDGRGSRRPRCPRYRT